jgi:PAS domain S-box-containing protein
MEDGFSFLNYNGLTTISTAHLQTIFDTIPFSIEILKALREGTMISDFEWVFANKAAKLYAGNEKLLGKKFLKSPGTDPSLFASLIKVVETGNSFKTTIPTASNGLLHVSSHHFLKFNDGVLVLREESSRDDGRMGNSSASRENGADNRDKISGLKKVETGNSENKDLLQSVFDTTSRGMCILEAMRNEKGKIFDFRYKLANLTAERMYNRGNLVGKTFFALHTIHKTDFFDTLVSVVETGEKSRMELPYDENGIESWFSASAAKLHDGVLLTFEDVTLTKKAEQRIKDDAHLTSQILNTSPDIIYIMDLNTYQIIYTNRSVAVQQGFAKHEIAKMNNQLLDIMHKDDVPAMLAHLKKIKTITSDEQVVEIEYRLKNAGGGYSWYCDRNSVFRRDSRNIPIEKVGISQNITSRKLQEQRLLIEKSLRNQAEAIVSMGTWEYTIATDEFKWSPGMYDLFNLPADIMPTPELYFDYVADEDKDSVASIVDNITIHCKAFEEVITIRPRGREKKIIKVRGTPVADEKNQPVKMIGVDLDITEHVIVTREIEELNNELEKKQQDLQTLNTELKTFNTITSSDYKETLQILYTNLEYIASKEGRKLADASKANIRRAQSAIQKMKLLTDDINNYLQLYEIGVSKSRIDPNQVINDLLEKIRPKILQSNAKIESLQLPTLLADPYLFSILMNNLIDNAIKYSKLIGTPEIKIKYSRADEINAISAALKNTPYIIISVSDNGLGFKEEEAEKVFDLFFRVYDKSKHRGSGIGLALCKKIMSMHGGFINAESIPGHGSTFNCFFPDML